MSKLKSFWLLFFLGILCVENSLAASVEEYRKETQAIIAYDPNGTELCFPKIRGNEEVHAVSVYEGGLIINPQVTRHPHRSIDVDVGETTKPVLLILNSYEPAVWRINASENAKISGVFLNGYHEQLVTGLPTGILVTRSRHNTRSKRKKSRSCVLASSRVQNAGAVKDLNARKHEVRSKKSNLKLKAIISKGESEVSGEQYSAFSRSYQTTEAGQS